MLHPNKVGICFYKAETTKCDGIIHTPVSTIISHLIRAKVTGQDDQQICNKLMSQVIYTDGTMLLNMQPPFQAMKQLYIFGAAKKQHFSSVTT